MSATPGPWSYGEGTRNYNVRAELGGVATVKKNLYTDNTRTEADARLIAAAPDLLDALKVFVSQDASHGLTEGERRDKAFAAISKAEAA